MIRRVHVSDLHSGAIALDPAEAHHIRDVLRLEAGSPLELFDDAGRTAAGIIKHVNSANVVVEVGEISAAAVDRAFRLTVASAIPKGDRADWMIEKLAELGVDRFIPLATERSVVLPGGRNKIERWERTAIESAKQSRRAGVMRIAALTSLDDAIKSFQSGWFLSTQADAISAQLAVEKHLADDLTLFIGPEGGWTDGEIARMSSSGLIAVGLTSTILRVETAAITAAGLVICHTETRSPPSSDSAPPRSR